MKYLFTAFIAFFLVACGGEKVENNDFIKVGTNATYPPFEYFDNSMQVAGFDIDLVKILSERLGFSYEIIEMSFDGLIPALQSGKIDMIASALTPTEQRAKAVDFSNSYFNTENVFIKRANDDSISNIDNLEGKKIGFQVGTTQEMAANELKNVAVEPAEDVASSFMMLKSGKIDVVLVDSSIGYSYLEKNPDLKAFQVVKDQSEGFAFAFAKGKHKELLEKINAELLRMLQDGSFDALLKKYELK